MSGKGINIVLNVCLFIISPIIGIFSQLLKRKFRAFYKSYVLFGIWLGLSIAIPDTSTSDITRVVAHYNYFKEFHLSIGEILAIHAKPDFVSPFSIYIFGSVLQLPVYVYFGFLGLIFSLISVRLLEIYSSILNVKSFHQLNIFVYAVLLIPVWYGINNVRFSLAVIIICTVIFNLTEKASLKSLFVLLSSIFVHYSVALVVAAYIIFHLTHKFIPIIPLFILFILLSVSVQLDDALSVTSSLLPENYKEASSSYVDPNIIQERIDNAKESQKTRSFHAFFLPWGRDIFFYLGTIYLGLVAIFNKKQLDNSFYKLIKWTLFLGCLVTVISNLPSFGRFKFFVIYPVALTVIHMLNRKVEDYSSQVIINTLSLFAFLYNVVKLRSLLNYLSIEFFYTNIISIMFLNLDSRTALIELIK